MTVVAQTQALSALAGRYEWLSALYLEEPGMEFVEEVRAGRLETPFDGDPEFAEGMESLHAFTKSAAGTDAAALNLALSGEFARLFVGPFQRTAHPFESVYVDVRQVGEEPVTGLLMGESVSLMRGLYRSAGVTFANPRNYSEDHLGLELGFMSWLIENREAGLSGPSETESFLLERLARWVPLFAERVVHETSGQRSLYRAVALLTAALLGHHSKVDAAPAQ